MHFSLSVFRAPTHPAMPQVGRAGVHAAQLSKRRKQQAKEARERAARAQPEFAGVATLGESLVDEPVVPAQVVQSPVEVADDKAGCCVIL